MNKSKINSLAGMIRWVLFGVSVLLFFTGYLNRNFNLALSGIIFIWIGNFIFSFQNLKSRIFFLFFNLSQFVFLIINPLISAFRGEKWWERYWEEAELFSVLSLFLSLLFLQIGAVIIDRYLITRQVKQQNIERKEYYPYLQLVSLIGFLGTWVCQIAVGCEKILFMRGKVYTEYYAGFVSNIPYVFQVAAAMMQYFLCLFLATKPRKKWSFTVLLLFIISAVPSLIIGIRNPIVLNCIFAFLYYFIRQSMDEKEKWLGRFEKICLIVIPPIAICLLGIYTYIRNSAQIAVRSIGNIFIDFFMNQGSSFDVLSIGYGAIPYLPERPFRNYTFGGIIDYFSHGTIAQKFFGASALPDGNNIVNALESNSFAHNMSYIAKGREAYLQGEGFGSSYILETFTDFGYIGIVLCSLILGAVLIYAMKWIKKNYLTFTITLVALTTIFFMPRAEALGWIQFLLYLQFWIPVICTVLGAKLLYMVANNLMRKQK